MGNVLLIDDDELICHMMSGNIKRMGHSPSCAHSLHAGKQEAARGEYDVILLDVKLPDGNGLDAIGELRNVPSNPEIIIITGLGDPDGAELAIQHKAWDYIEKTSTPDGMILTLSQALSYREEKKNVVPAKVLKRSTIIGNSPKLQECFLQLARASESKANVLITGETGTGKELFANAIHNNSNRAQGNFVIVDCASLPESLVESVLFGHVKGSFTGAERSRDGLIKQANGGTLFLDEIGELPLSIQKNFLRVLQEHRFRPVGSNEEIVSDFRLIAATNRNLEEMAQEGTFREDLFYRLRTLTLELPPLRDRKEDIKEIALEILQKRCDQHGIAIKGVSPEFVDCLLSYDWPGNVRDLINAIEDAVSQSFYESTLYPKHLPTRIRIHKARQSIDKSAQSEDPTDMPGMDRDHFPTLQDMRESSLAELERRYLNDLMILTQGNIQESCNVAGVSRSRLYELIKKYDIKTDR